MLIDPKVDFAFKWLFGQEKNALLLVQFLNAVLEQTCVPEFVTIEIFLLLDISSLDELKLWLRKSV
ncbi:MAG: Rpn family recombination-promoting nuclease/putative transposase [Candidatus Obscuribacterales bacterium]|nr:Rpn family recombination-promoting nuclease/putative transposase [Candidatus Obscuribacterales bacterium]